MNVIWKDIDGNREIYQVSNNGNVRTKTRKGARNGVVSVHNLTQRKNSNGYLRVNMHLKGVPNNKSYLVHRIVAEQFIDNPDNKLFVNHIDGNKLNNAANNLEWCTKSENKKHAWATGLKKDVATKGEKHGMHKLTSVEVLNIRKNHKRNGGKFGTGELSKIYKVHPQTITNIVGNKNWKDMEAIYGTPTRTGMEIPLKILSRYFTNVGKCVEAVYVTRSYTTRHGMGALKDTVNIDQINSFISDQTNKFNMFQGGMRFGLLFPKDLVRRINDDFQTAYFMGTKKSLMVTHLNETKMDIASIKNNFSNVYISETRFSEDIKLYRNQINETKEG